MGDDFVEVPDEEASMRKSAIRVIVKRIDRAEPQCAGAPIDGFWTTELSGHRLNEADPGYRRNDPV